MRKLNLVLLVPLIVVLPILGTSALGQCVPDANNTAADAKPINLTQTISDWVCPDDQFDFYSLVISPGQDVSGDITFTSPQTGTVLRLLGTAGVIFEQGTTDAKHTLNVPIASGSLPADTYYARITYYSAYAFDHEYTFTLNLAVAGPGQMQPPSGMLAGPKLPGGLNPGKIALQPTSPWPSRRYDAANRGCSPYNGPNRRAFKSKDFDILKDLSLTNAGTLGFNGLITGPNNRIYFTYGDGNALVAYDLSTGYLHQNPVGFSGKPFSLDYFGNVYVIDPNKTQLECLGADGSKLWGANMEGGGTEGVPRGVGQYVYASTLVSILYPGIGELGQANYVDVWDESGGWGFVMGTFDNKIIGVAEDPDGFSYAQTTDKFAKYDWQGHQLWRIDLAFTGDDEDAAKCQGPIIGYDGRVLVVTDPYIPEYRIVNPDGSIYKSVVNPGGHAAGGLIISGGFMPRIPAVFCMDNNGRLYVAIGNRITCYTGWTEKVWDVPFSMSCAVQDMLIGGNGVIYVLYTAAFGVNGQIHTVHWVSLNLSDGNVIADVDIGIPDAARQKLPGQLALGENGKLVYLNAGRYLAVFESGLDFSGPFFKPEKFKLL